MFNDLCWVKSWDVIIHSNNQVQHSISLCEAIQKDHLLWNYAQFHVLDVGCTTKYINCHEDCKKVCNACYVDKHCGNHHVGVVDFSFCKNCIQVVLCPSSKNQQTCAHKLLSKLPYMSCQTLIPKCFWARGGAKV